MSETPWQDALYDRLKARGVSIVTYVPDGGHKRLIVRAAEDPDMTDVPVTSEEEGVALVAGAHLGGRLAVLLMQSSGVGNTINMLSLIKHGRFPFVTLVTMRGEFGESNPWQLAMGEAVVPTMQALGVRIYRAEGPEDVLPCIDNAITMATRSDIGVAVLLSQRLLGAKDMRVTS